MLLNTGYTLTNVRHWHSFEPVLKGAYPLCQDTFDVDWS